MQDELWQQEAKRLGGESLVQVIEDIRNDQKTIIKRLDDMDDRHTTSETAIAKLKLAFPDGDIEGHRRYHQTMIDMLNERRRLRVAIEEKTISGLIWAAIVGISMAVWHELLSAFGKGS